MMVGRRIAGMSPTVEAGLLDSARRPGALSRLRGFPWFLDATIAQILDLERPHAGHLRWPRLDIDLSVESIEHPGRFPLKSRRGPAPE